MKIQFLSTSSNIGGAARATYWLAKGLRVIGEDVSMLVRTKTVDSFWVSEIQRSNVSKFVEFARVRLNEMPLRLYSSTERSTWSLNLVPDKKLGTEILKIKPEIVNLHWVGGGFLPISHLRQINAPIVWSLYDMWPFTGGCHYDNSCGRFTDQCGNCPQLDSKKIDLSSLILNRKKKHFKEIPMTIVAPSKWLADEARGSSLFGNHRIEIIPHGTDLKLFKPINKLLAREILDLPKKRRYVLFGAMQGTSDKRKGYQYLEPALRRLKTLPGFQDISLLVFGATEQINSTQLEFPIHYVGRLHDDLSLAVLYSAADVTVTPSMQEAFGMTASESMACGTPVVAFGVCGPLDVIDHKINGYLAKPFEFEDLTNGLMWTLDVSRAMKLSNECRKKCENSFELESVANRYKQLYAELIKEQKSKVNK